MADEQKQGSGRGFTDESVQEGPGEIACDGNIRTNSHTLDGSTFGTLHPCQPPNGVP